MEVREMTVDRSELMAIYEYQCEECGVEFQARRSMKYADALIAGPGCGGDHTQRGLSMFLSARSGGGSSASGAAGSNSGCGSCSNHSCAS